MTVYSARGSWAWGSHTQKTGCRESTSSYPSALLEWVHSPISNAQEWGGAGGHLARLIFLLHPCDPEHRGSRHQEVALSSGDFLSVGWVSVSSGENWHWANTETINKTRRYRKPEDIPFTNNIKDLFIFLEKQNKCQHKSTNVNKWVFVHTSLWFISDFCVRFFFGNWFGPEPRASYRFNLTRDRTSTLLDYNGIDYLFAQVFLYFCMPIFLHFFFLFQNQSWQHLKSHVKCSYICLQGKQ